MNRYVTFGLGLALVMALGFVLRHFYATFSLHAEPHFIGKGEVKPLTEQLSVVDARVQATIPGIKVSSGYLTLINTSDQEIVITGVSTDAAKHTELHRMFLRDNRMAMRKVEQVVVPANGRFEFAPDGFHLMLTHLNQRLVEGDIISVQLMEQNGTLHTVEFAVVEMKPHH
ncbi:copper chaperone PCu(A)C [Vibrio sp. IRLE0018]|uniref:copper chaperone PCu(A)C n=1 Tax=Vibrio floridensis TaxID=2908007 RepID=UPI001F3DFA85|nr:copper chaperone PCu(A)C [Vibrio floridensis]MCF8778206.1 copper chaperone PCu(A)C [Vibrio floridensis]